MEQRTGKIDTPAAGAATADKLLAAPGTKWRLALASGLVLAAGLLLAPRTAPTALSTPQERAAPLIEQQVQPPPPDRSFRGVQDVARRVRDHSVTMPAPRRGPRTVSDFAESAPPPAGGFGVFVSTRHVLTHATALDGRSTLPLTTADGRTLGARVTAFEPATGLVLLETEAPRASSPPLAAAAPDPGALSVAVGRAEGGDIAVPVFVTGAGENGYRVSGVDGTTLPGMPIYTLDGELLAVVSGDGAGFALAARDAAARLMALAAAGDRQQSFGLAVQDLSGPLADAMGGGSVVVSEVVAGGPADRAGIQAGDVVIDVGGSEAASAEAVATALAAAGRSSAVTLRLRRAGRVRSADLAPRPAYEVAALARVTHATAAAGVDVRALLTAAQIDAASLPPSARVVRVNGRAIGSRADWQREVRRGQGPVLLLLRDGRRQFFTTLEPPR